MSIVNIPLKPLSLNTPYNKGYMMHPKVMNIANLVDSFCTIEYNCVYVLCLGISM